jgi:hypothetical protein
MTSSTTLLWEELLSSKTPVPMQPINPSFFDEHYLLFVICLPATRPIDKEPERDSRGVFTVLFLGWKPCLHFRKCANIYRGNDSHSDCKHTLTDNCTSLVRREIGHFLKFQLRHTGIVEGFQQGTAFGLITCYD